MYEEKEEDDEQWPVAQVMVPANALEYLQSIFRNPAEPDGRRMREERLGVRSLCAGQRAIQT